MVKIENFILKTGEYELFTTEIITLEKGEKILLVGKNSTGKSLFLKSLHKQYFNHNGNFEIKNDGFLKKRRKESLLIDNQVNLIPEQTIYKNIILPLKKINDRKIELISDLCREGGLGEIYSVKISQLSYSQCKMVEIIRAIVVNPLVILLDDLDNYFDDINISVMFKLFEISKAKHSLIATSKKIIENFNQIYRIQNQKVVKL